MTNEIKLQANTLTDAIVDSKTGNKLKELLSYFNSYYLPFYVNREHTRLQVPLPVRKRGIWLTYCNPKTGETRIECYDGDDVSDNAFKNDCNWIELKDIVTEIVVKHENSHTIFSRSKYELEGTYSVLTADRAICDAFGNIIHDTYLTRSTVSEFINSVMSGFFDNWKYEIPDGSITYEMLSSSLKAYLKRGGSITNMPDEEDLTAENDVLKFKDRTYDESTYNGMGYKILRRNWANGINLLESWMINEPNTIYEVRYEFCLNGETIEIPENSILSFKGGSFTNGFIIYNGKTIDVSNILHTVAYTDQESGSVFFWNGSSWATNGIMIT